MVKRVGPFLLLLLAAAVLTFLQVPVRYPISDTVGQVPIPENQPAVGADDEISLIDPPLPIPKETIDDALGRAIDLSGFKGSVVLLNFWATWCSPCVEEMPSLDRLQGALAGEGLKVVAVSVDTDGVKAVAPFLRDMGLEKLEIYTDSRSRLFAGLKGEALPTTFLIDREGRIVRRWVGAIAWDGEKAKTLIRSYLTAPTAG